VTAVNAKAKVFLKPETEFIRFEEEIITASGCPCKGANCGLVCDDECTDVEN